MKFLGVAAMRIHGGVVPMPIFTPFVIALRTTLLMDSIAAVILLATNGEYPPFERISFPPSTAISVGT